jgi:hypothetical protein
MSIMPEEWEEACTKSENRLKDYIPIVAINPTLCMESSCPAAKVLPTLVPGGMVIQVYCTFSKCVHRLPEKRDFKLFK